MPEEACLFEATAALVVKQERAAIMIEPKDPEKETEIADAGGDEMLSSPRPPHWAGRSRSQSANRKQARPAPS